MKNYLKFTPVAKAILTFVFVFLLLTSCKKELISPPQEEKIGLLQANCITPEKVDITLLNNYINYQLKVEANALIQKAGKNVKFLTPVMAQKEFELMIENYLANERNMILANSFLKKTSSAKIGLLEGDIIYFDDGAAQPFYGIGHFPGSSITNIVFTGSLSNSGVISQQGFSFGGVHGTIAQTGNLSQSVHNGVTTYQQHFTETYTFPGGIVYTQQFVVYGNIYGSTVTVTGMSIPPPGN
jgi:hypothetical protein